MALEWLVLASRFLVLRPAAVLQVLESQRFVGAVGPHLVLLEVVSPRRRSVEPLYRPGLVG
ncbi:MAG: hypothetical protein QW680_12080 [Pyrobaculum sp.]